MKTSDITYVTENVVEEYVFGLRDAICFDEIKKHLTEWRWIANDAYEIVNTDEDFKKFIIGKTVDYRLINAEKKGKFTSYDELSDHEKECVGFYAAVTMPKILMDVNIIANKYKVPWGLMFCRLRDAGKLKIEDGGIMEMVE